MKRKMNNRQANSLQTSKSVKPAANAAKSPAGSRPVNTGDRPLAAFLQTAEIKTRQCVYIDRDTHSKIACIITRIGNGLSIGRFVDNILRDHIRKYREQYIQAIEKSKSIDL